MLSIAESALSDVPLTDTDKPGFRRYIKRTPLGVVLVIAPWKYALFSHQGHNVKLMCSSFPYLVSVNAVLPAIIAGRFLYYYHCLRLISISSAGNAVLFKPSPQTPLTAERFALALTRAGVPEDVIQVVHLSPSLTSFVVQHTSVDFVSFTGSVVGGRAVEQAAATARGFKGVALEVCSHGFVARKPPISRCGSLAAKIPRM